MQTVSLAIPEEEGGKSPTDTYYFHFFFFSLKEPFLRIWLEVVAFSAHREEKVYRPGLFTAFVSFI